MSTHKENPEGRQTDHKSAGFLMPETDLSGTAPAKSEYC